MAWPVQARPSLPGPGGFAAAALLTAIVMIAAAVLAGRRFLAGRSRRGYASARQIRTRLSENAVLARADVIHPSLAGPRHYEGPDRDQYAAAREQAHASIAEARPGSLPATLAGGLETGTQ